MNIVEMIERLVRIVGKKGEEAKVEILKEEEDFKELLDIADENVKVIDIVNSAVEYLGACGNCNVEKIYINGGAYLGTDLDRKMDELEQEMLKELKCVKEVDEITLIEMIEGGSILVKDEEDLEIVRKLAKDLSRSQGFYGRLYEDLKGMEEALPFVL